MLIPSNELERFSLYQEVSNACMASREDRQQEYASREAYYLYGNPSGSNPSEYNKVYPSVQTLASFLFAAESTTFALELAPDASETDIQRISVVSRQINHTWERSKSDSIATQCVEWSLVYNTMVMKTLWRDRKYRSYSIRPHDFGVYEEDKCDLEDQEAMAHAYYITLPQLTRMLDGHPRRDQILRNVQSMSAPREEEVSGLDRLILTASAPITQQNPNAIGALSAAATMPPPNYSPHVAVQLVEMRELWVWNDREDDYQIVTQAGDVTIYDRQAAALTKQGQMFPRGEHPFTAFTPTPKYNYFWGISDVSRVQMLQDKYNKRMMELDNLLAKQIDPPRHGMGLTDEQLLALSFVGGKANTSDPMAKVELLIPEVPPELIRSLSILDEEFADTLAMPNILMGKGESGVRGRGHAQELARLASSRIKRKSLNIENSLERVATLMMKILRLNDATKLPDPSNGGAFVLDQFISDCIVKVDAHSNSPIFAEDMRTMAAELLSAGIIDGESFIDMVKPPMMELLKLRLRENQQQAAQAQAAEQQAQQAQEEQPSAQQA
jgi:hypothetical protein